MDIYHYNRCSKSRQALQFLSEQSVSFVVNDYQNNPPSIETIGDLIGRSEHDPIEFVRMNNDINLKTTATVSEIASFLSNNPQLMQRPIIDSGTHVIIARPLQLLAEIPQFSNLLSDE